MSKRNKFTKSSKTVIAGALGVGVLLSTPSLLSAETHNQNEVKVQTNVEVKGTESKENPPKTDIQKQEDQKEKVQKDKEGNQIKPEEKEKQTVQNESKPKAENAKQAEVTKEKQNETQEKPAPSQKPVETEMNIYNILIGVTNQNGIWTKPIGVEGSQFVGNANEFIGQIAHISKKMVVDNTTWYKFEIKGKEVGWVKSILFDDKLTDVTSLHPFTQIVGQDTNDGIWSVPYGARGASYIASSNVYSFDTITITAKAKINGQQWYAFRVDEKQIGWIHEKAFDNGAVTSAYIFSTVILGNSDRHAIWTKPYGLANSKYVAPISQYAYEELRLIHQVSVQGTKWGQIQKDGRVLGWIDLDNANAKKNGTYLEPIGTGVASVKGNGTAGHGIWTKPYGEEDAKWVASVSDFSNHSVNILQKVSIYRSGGSATWCKIQDGNRVLGWVDAKTLLDRSIYKQDRYAVIGSGKDHLIWSTPYGLEGARNLGNLSDYANYFAYVDKSMKIDNTTWYHINIDGRDMGWIDKRSTSNESYARDTVYRVTTNDTSHGVWSKPYGIKNATWIDSAVAYKNKKLQIKQCITVGNTEWYGFDDERGGLYWIDGDFVK